MSRHIHIAGVAKTYQTRGGAVESLKPIDLHVELTQPKQYPCSKTTIPFDFPASFWLSQP